MPCAIGCFAIFFPRIALIIVWLASDYLEDAYRNVSLIWPILGFFFLPLTTLAYAFAINQNGSVNGLYLVVVILAVLFDLGLLGGGGAAGRRHRSRTIEVTRVRAR
jgi:hypothetical protein